MATAQKTGVAANGGHLFVVSAPSGAGKTTLCQAARERLPELVYSVSSTTRQPRAGEVEGRDYFFVSEARFEQGIADGSWAEWARVHDNYYGTSARFLEDHLAAGRDVVLWEPQAGGRRVGRRRAAERRRVRVGVHRYVASRGSDG